MIFFHGVKFFVNAGNNRGIRCFKYHGLTFQYHHSHKGPLKNPPIVSILIVRSQSGTYQSGLSSLYFPSRRTVRNNHWIPE